MSMQIAATVLNRAIVRKALFGAPIRLASGFVSWNMPRAALLTLRVPERLYRPNDRMLSLLAKAQRMKGNSSAYARAEVNRLHALAKRYSAQNNFAGLLECLAQLEAIDRSAPLIAGQKIASQVVSTPGRERLLKAGLKLQKTYPDSLYMEHLISLCQAFEGQYQEAGHRLAEKLDTVADITDPLERYRYELLRSTWRRVDQIAREQMEWSDSAKDIQDQLRDETNEDARALIHRRGVKEVLLQARMRDEYLDLCEEEFRSGEKIKDKVRALIDMLRQGTRQIPSYAESYKRASTCLDEIMDDVQAILKNNPLPLHSAQKGANVDALSMLLELTTKLNRTALATKIAGTLIRWADTPEMERFIFPVGVALYHNDQDLVAADRIMGRVKTGAHLSPRQIRDYFRWAMLARDHDAAHQLFEQLTAQQRKDTSTLFYAHVLTREGRFSEALNQVKAVQGFLLSRPHKLNAMANFDLIKRVGELRFLAETAKTYTRVPQPQNPVGVVLIAPRNIEQLRRNPLAPLIEMKRRGWAVIPLVEGLLPKEETGIEELDVLNSAISGHRYLSKAAEDMFAPLENMTFHPATGVCKWGDMDLTHAVWEDASVNRRRHTIDYSCPALQQYCANLVKWTEAVARCIQHAHKVTTQSGLRLGMLTPFAHRLPDVLFPKYCNSLGDPDTCFFLHGANGYQNYFTNFSTNVSVRYALRNMTRVPHVRTASFPVPENFMNYYKENAHRSEEVLEKFAGITKVKRSTAGQTTLPPEAQAAAERIDAWRAKGGKVVCAFGKVLCDSSVPYDGGPGHKHIRDWINHAIRAVRGTNTLLLIKPHPHELNDQIATFPTEYFRDILTEEFGENTMFLEHRWFDIHDIGERIDMGLVYNGTTTVELGLMGVPCLLSSHFASTDYPIGQATFEDRQQFSQHLRFDIPIIPAADLRQRAAMWLEYMANEDFTQPYRYHVRPVTNKSMYPPWWWGEDVERYFSPEGDPAVATLVDRALGLGIEPGHPDYIQPEGVQEDAFTISA